MNRSANPPSKTAPIDEDLAEQARSGHGIPSQDPDTAAQLPLEPGEAEREADSVLAGGGAIVGVAAGAAIGTVVAGPVGAVVGGTVGAVAGALGGAAAGPLVNTEDLSVAGKAPAKKPAPAH
jgi:hypothetical protein